MQTKLLLFFALFGSLSLQSQDKKEELRWMIYPPSHKATYIDSLIKVLDQEIFVGSDLWENRLIDSLFRFPVQHRELEFGISQWVGEPKRLTEEEWELGQNYELIFLFRQESIIAIHLRQKPPDYDIGDQIDGLMRLRSQVSSESLIKPYLPKARIIYSRIDTAEFDYYLKQHNACYNAHLSIEDKHLLPFYFVIYDEYGPYGSPRMRTILDDALDAYWKMEMLKEDDPPTKAQNAKHAMELWATSANPELRLYGVEGMFKIAMRLENNSKDSAYIKQFFKYCDDLPERAQLERLKDIKKIQMESYNSRLSDENKRIAEHLRALETEVMDAPSCHGFFAQPIKQLFCRMQDYLR